MADDLVICATCGREPGFLCREHFARDIREATARAEKAEAACAQKHAALEGVLTVFKGSFDHHAPSPSPSTHAYQLWSALRCIDIALASDCGKGWVSPEHHAAMVRERVKLLEAVVKAWSIAFSDDLKTLIEFYVDYPLEELAPCAVELRGKLVILRDALAALDAHDKQHEYIASLPVVG